MVHNTNKKALYEVIGRAGSKPGYEQLHPNGTAGEIPSTNPVTPPNVVRWVIKPGIIQFNAGRIELSIPYQVAIVITLGMLLAAVVLFRLGQRIGNRDVSTNTPVAIRPVVNKPVESKPVMPKPVMLDTPVVKQPAEQDTSVAPAGAVGPISTGRNRIVLKVFQVRSHLEPAKEYFDKLGVATEIVEKNNWYYLVTKNKYDNPKGQEPTDTWPSRR